MCNQTAHPPCVRACRCATTRTGWHDEPSGTEEGPTDHLLRRVTTTTATTRLCWWRARIRWCHLGGTWTGTRDTYGPAGLLRRCIGSECAPVECSRAARSHDNGCRWELACSGAAAGGHVFDLPALSRFLPDDGTVTAADSFLKASGVVSRCKALEPRVVGPWYMSS